MRKLALLLFLLLATPASAQTIIPGIPFRFQGGGTFPDTTCFVGNVRMQGNLTVSGSFGGTSSTNGDSLRANLQFFMGGASTKKILPSTFTHDWANCTAGTTLDETQTITGVTVADNWLVLVCPKTAMSAGLLLQTGAWVTADNQITMRIGNKCAADVDNPSQSFVIYCFKL